ncbi:hypothetical protein ABT093_37960 [Kitasatospora sp. NPDC002551]|uniref:hypothetical protein n=1 Tax=Kitasatospora sp. NPDC002551 TaxID=3154539 RepID=UPI00332EAAD9
MAFWPKSTNPPAAADASPAGRTPTERRRREREIRRIDAATAKWLARGGRPARLPKDWS